MVDKLRIGMDLEGNGCGLIEVLYQHLPGGTEEHYVNQASPRCKSRVLLLHHP
jgi:hypothetical protein